MSRRVAGVTLDNLEDLPKHCRACVYWELAPHLRDQAEEFGTTVDEEGLAGRECDLEDPDGNRLRVATPRA